MTDTETPEEKLENRKWKHRRRMAYISLVSIIVVTLLVFFSVDSERLEILKEPITWFYFSMASIVGAYMGFSTWASK